jgi:hypothetical protein
MHPQPYPTRLGTSDPTPPASPALHLLGGIWVASCPTCGYQLVTARTQARCERRAAPADVPGLPPGRPAMSRAQHILAAIVGLITAVLLLESYGAMVTAARAGGRAIPELWPLGTEALALAMEVSVLEAKRLGHRAVLRLSWVLLVASVALSTLLQIAVAPPTLVGYLTAGATPVWLLGSSRC